jgi:hypothetical protein
MTAGSNGDQDPPQTAVKPEVAAGEVDPVSLLVSLSDDVDNLDKYQVHSISRPSKQEKPKKQRPSLIKSLSPKRSWTGSLHEYAPAVVNIVATEVATFYDVFGVLGVPMIIMFVVSAAWTFMMAAIQVHADTIANTVMNTTEFDNGEFWLLPKPSSGIVISSVILLSLFGIGYTGLAVVMVFFYRAGAPKDDLSVEALTESSRGAAIQVEIGHQGSLTQRVVTWARALPADIRDHYFVRSCALY